MEAETSQNGIIPLTEKARTRDWLIEIMNEQEERSIKRTGEQAEQQTRPKTRIQKVNKTQREAKWNEGCFDPLVVSLGPYHHGKEDLMPMERSKNDAARWFISLAMDKLANSITQMEDQANDVYDKFITKAPSVSSLRESYDEDEFFHRFESEDFMRMMFVDGCFILHFINLVVKGSSDECISKNSHHLNQALIVRDMFLVENQIPYPILNALMSLLPDREISQYRFIEFIFTVYLPPYELNFSEIGWLRVLILIIELFGWPIWEQVYTNSWNNLFVEGNEPLHLFDILRGVVIGIGTGPEASNANGYWYNYFRPIRELKAKGIQVRRSYTKTLQDVKFKKGLLYSHLEIPQIVVDDSTKTRLINLVAYEMFSDGPKDRTVTSYVCLLHSLIYNADDVRELQSHNVLLNRLGSNEEVAKLFKELATGLSPHYNAYGLVINGIKGHFSRLLNNDRVRIGKWIGQFIRTYFSSPWTLISLIAAAFVIVLTLLQTIYTMWGFYKTF